ncbi:MAG: hypothetical protein NVS4B3_12240 [Gemmatimonadaceae bacterium]
MRGFIPVVMSDSDGTALPARIASILAYFAALGREEKMHALVQYSRKLEALPERFVGLDRGQFAITECQTRVDIFPEFRDGHMHFYADIDARRSPTIAAVLAIVFAAVNDQPPATTLAIPGDFVRTLMSNIGLGAREPGLTAMIARLRRYAAEAQAKAA